MRTAIKVIAIAAVLGSFVHAKAQVSTPGIPVVPLGYCQLTDVAAAKALTACSGGIPTGANAAIIQAEAKNIRYRDDTVVPTTTVGVQIAAGAGIYYAGTLTGVRIIEEAATAKVNILFYRAPN